MSTDTNELKHGMVIHIPLTSINFGNRMRTEYDGIPELAESIVTHGLIQPLGIDRNKNLVVGGRRYKAIETLKEKPIYSAVPCYVEGCDDEIELRMMELEENIRRKDMTWKEKVNAVAEVHLLHTRKAHLTGARWTQKMTGELLNNTSAGHVNYCVNIAELLKDPTHPVHKAESLTDAFRVLLDLKEQEHVKFNSSFAVDITKASGTMVAPTRTTTLSIDALIEQADQAAGDQTTEELLQAVSGDPSVASPTPKAPEKPLMQVKLSEYFRFGSCLTHMQESVGEVYDHIVTDSPYAINMANLEQNSGLVDTSKVAAEHDVEENLDLMTKFFPLAYKVLRDKAFCVVWVDSEHRDFMLDRAVDAGFKVCRWPLIWVKTHRCKNEAAAYNFTKATEEAIVLRKGNATLAAPQGTNYWIGSNEAIRAKFPDHNFVKPYELWTWILKAVAHKDQIIYDPFNGVGTCTYAAAKSGFFPRGSELNQAHYQRSIVEYKELMTTWWGKSHNLQFI